MKLVITTDRQPWWDDRPHSRGDIIEVEDAVAAKKFQDDDLAVPAKPAAVKEARKDAE